MIYIPCIIKTNESIQELIYECIHQSLLLASLQLIVAISIICVKLVHLLLRNILIKAFSSIVSDVQLHEDIPFW